MATICHTNEKLEASHHKFQRRLLGITWRDMVRNEDIIQNAFLDLKETGRYN